MARRPKTADLILLNRVTEIEPFLDDGETRWRFDCNGLTYRYDLRFQAEDGRKSVIDGLRWRAIREQEKTEDVLAASRALRAKSRRNRLARA